MVYEADPAAVAGILERLIAVGTHKTRCSIRVIEAWAGVLATAVQMRELVSEPGAALSGEGAAGGRHGSPT